MYLVKNNPNRIIGILTGSSIPNPEDDFSFPVLGKLDRTDDDFIQARNNLSSNRKRLEASLFWFYRGNELTDDLAFASLAKDKLMGALDIWLDMTVDQPVRLENASAFSNLSTLYLSGVLDDHDLSKQNLQRGIGLKLKFLESYFFHDFVELATDEYFKISRNDLERTFLWKLLRECVANNYMKYEEFVSITLEHSCSGKQDFLYDVIRDVGKMKETC